MPCADWMVQRIVYLSSIAIVFRDAGARFHRVGGNAVDDDAMTDDVVGLGKRRIGRCGIADLVEEGLVAGVIVPDRLCAVGDGLLDAKPRRAAGRSRSRSTPLRPSPAPAFRRRRRRRLADKAHAVTGEQRLRRDMGGGSVALLSRCARPLRTKPPSLQLRRREDGVHAGRGPRGVCVDRTQDSMGMGGTRPRRHEAVRRGSRHPRNDPCP